MKIDGLGTQEYKVELTGEAAGKAIDGRALADAVSFGSSFAEFFTDDVENVSLLGESEGAMDALKSKAAALKDNLSAIFDKMDTGAVVQMGADGIDVNNTEAKELVTVVEEIQIKLAMYCDDFEATVDIDSSSVEAVMGQAAAMTYKEELSDGAKEYLLKNNLKPTLQNIYIAEHAGTSSYSHKPLKESQWQEIMPQVDRVIEKTGLPVEEKTRELGRWLVDRDIPVTEENITKLKELEVLQSDDFSNRIAATIMEGYKASSTLITSERLPWEETVVAISTVERATEANVMWWATASIPKTLAELDKAIDNGKVMIPDYSDDKFLTATRQIHEVRLMMTINAGRTLEKNGIDINTTEIAELVEELRSYELEQVNRNLSAEIQYTSKDVAKANEALTTFMALRNAPAVVLGSVVKTGSNADAIALAVHANPIREEYEKAGKAYEALSTEIRKDLGDSVLKAVNASTEDILNNLNLENNEANRRAVRILAYNEMDITEKNIDRVKVLDESVNTLFKRLNPMCTLEMIREGKDILTTPVDELSEYLLEQQEVLQPKEEKFSEFLYRLDKKGGIDSADREKFIGIYSMVNRFQKDGMNAIGSLINQGLELNMGNLLTAFYSRKDKGMEFSVDDTTPTVHVKDKVTYYKNLFGRTADKITPDKLENMADNLDEMSPEQFADNMQEEITGEDALYLKYLEDVKEAANMEPEVYKFISDNSLPETINSIMTAREFMGNGKKMFSDYDRETAENSAEEILKALDDKESLLKEYDKMVENTKKLLEEAHLTRNSYVDMEALRMMGNQVNMVQALSRNNYFCIPFEGENTEGIIHLKVVEAEDNKGVFNIKLTLKNSGQITIEGKVENNTIKAVIMCQEQAEQSIKEGLSKLEEQLYSAGYEELKISVNVAKDQPLGNTKVSEKTSTQNIYRAAKIFITNIAN